MPDTDNRNLPFRVWIGETLIQISVFDFLGDAMENGIGSTGVD